MQNYAQRVVRNCFVFAWSLINTDVIILRVVAIRTGYLGNNIIGTVIE